MPKIGARSDLKKPANYIKRNLGPEAREQLNTKILAKAEKQEALRQAKVEKTKKLHEQAKIRRNNDLERVPEQDIVEFPTLDFSTEEQGYFTRRDKLGNVIDVIETLFPR